MAAAKKGRAGKPPAEEPRLSPGGTALFGRVPTAVHALGGLVLAVILCTPLFLRDAPHPAVPSGPSVSAEPTP